MAAYLQGEPLRAGRLGLLPGAFNPPTHAHLGLAAAAEAQHRLDQIVFVLPKALPHKEFEAITFEEKVSLTKAAVADHSSWAVGSSDGGLVVEIAAEFRELCGAATEIFALCGRDAAARIVRWNYGAGPSIAEQLRRHQMIVAARGGQFDPPLELQSRILTIDLPDDLQAISSSQVREAIAAGRPWRHLVVKAVARIIDERKLYR